MAKKYFLLGITSLLIVGIYFHSRPAIAAKIESLKKRIIEVLVVNNDSNPIPVMVKNFSDPVPIGTPSATLQQWEHWYQCHPNPTNEAEIRGYLNDRGRDGFEVVAAAGVGSLICEYYKRPKQ